MQFLGHLVNQNGISVDSAKVEAVMRWGGSEVSIRDSEFPRISQLLSEVHPGFLQDSRTPDQANKESHGLSLGA